jgi:hypothetical protein
METGGHAVLEYHREGVVCEVVLPPSSILRFDETKIAEIGPPTAATPIVTDGRPENDRILTVEDSLVVSPLVV